ncbi:MAG: glycosyltransferase family 2 protein [Bacteroidales bacterium]|nr:glycosyltransferase family 2 protein [Bacteroidales bacterium]MCF8455592.1 glycosyltransferase family 2 protein [Bacteroidales bacterium]
MEIIRIILQIIEYVLYIYLGLAAVYIFIFGVASIFSHKPKAASTTTNRKFAVLIPGYKEDSVIVDVALDALNQDYPKEKYDVVVIADSFAPATLEELRKLPIKLVEVSFEKSTKSKALNKAMATIGDGYDVALILDADNMMAPDFITKINQAFNRGFIAVQGHRAAKNLNTSLAILDAISEEVNNSIFRKGHRVLGLSSALIGSGMAFDYAFFKEIMSNVKAIGGFDKELELKMLRDKIKIEYVNDALVLDEKVQKSDVFANQRRRWLSAQFIYFRRFVGSGLYHLFFKGNIDFFDKVIQMVQPPRVILLGVVSILTGLYALLLLPVFENLEALFVFSFHDWKFIFALTFIAFIASIPGKFYNIETLKAIITLPKAFLVMATSMLKLKGANKKFIHTQHGTNEK